MLAEAEEAGAEALDLAKAANARGEALFATPDRAKAFFEWAHEKDPSYPVPAFNLAKQAATLGELDEAARYHAGTCRSQRSAKPGIAATTCLCAWGRRPLYRRRMLP